MLKPVALITTVALGLTALIGCSKARPGVSTTPTPQTDMYKCVYTDTALAADDEALGTTPAALQAELDGLHTHDATWEDDGSATVAQVALTLDLAGALLRESEGCGSFISIPATASIDTDDGGISAVFDMDLEIGEGGDLRAWATIDPSEVGGSWTPRDLDPNESRRGITLQLERGDAGGLLGQLMDETEGSDGSVAWAGAEVVLNLAESAPITQ